MSVSRSIQPKAVRRLGLVAIPMIAFLPVLTACGGEEEPAAESTYASSAVSSAASESTDPSAQSTAAEEGEASEADKATATEVAIEADPTTDLSDGDTISATVTGLDPELGYYASICSSTKVPGNPVPNCTGDRKSGNKSQQWLTNKPGGTVKIAENGTATFELGVVSKGEKADCTRQECVFKVFGDHTEGFEDVSEVPVTFAQ